MAQRGRLGMRTLDRQDISDLLHGAAILGTGGGGDLAEGFGLIDAALDAGGRFRLATLDEMPPETLVATPYLLGAISQMPEEERAQYDRLPQSATHPLLLATDRLSEHLGQKIDAFVPCEMGGSNTAVPFFVAAMRGGIVLDADPAGRAVPGITHSTYYLEGLLAAPVAMANTFGETFLIQHVIDDARVEALARAICVASGHDVSAVDHALPVGQIAPAIIPGTLSRAMRLGALARTSPPGELPEILASAVGGVVACRGAVQDCHHETREGFTFGQFTVVSGPSHYAVTFKNENMIGRWDGAVHATIPDMICVLDTQTGLPVTNPHATPGQEVAILILPAPSAFLTEKGLDSFGPKYAGLNGAFKSVLDQS